MIAQNQMELTFNSNVRRPAAARRSRNLSRSRARWWFAQMRAVVDAATDWQSGPPCPVRQAELELAARN